jgi:hypothetical protein
MHGWIESHISYLEESRKPRLTSSVSAAFLRELALMGAENYYDQYEWILKSMIRVSQPTVSKKVVEKFKKKYLEGKILPAPEAYFDDERGLYIIQDGHHRLTALYELAQEGYQLLGSFPHTQQIAEGVTLRVFQLPKGRHPHTQVFKVSEVKKNI